MVTTNDVWGSMRVPKNDHQNKVANVLRGHKVPKHVRDKIWDLIHEYNVGISEKIAADLNKWEKADIKVSNASAD